jgi:hypothetical protein
MKYPKLLLSDQNELDLLAARAVYEVGLPFTVFEHPAIQNFLTKLNPPYRSPKRFQLDNSLLNSMYESVKKQIDTIINEEDALSVVFYETTNINNERVLILAVTTKCGAFYYENSILSSDTVSSERIADLLVPMLQNVSRNGLERINAVTTDTCALMKNI